VRARSESDPRGRPRTGAEGARIKLKNRSAAALLPLSVLLLSALLLPAGCVYYNTFYHAKAAARQAELMREARPPGSSPGQRETELLERAVEKSGRVLQLHPDSEWADDALLLMGSSYYHQGRYESAESRLNQFISLYPDSELRSEAEYMLASVLLAAGNPTSAERLLESLARAEPPREFSDDALALIGRARHDRGEYAEAAEAYESALERFPGSDRRAEIRFLAAENSAAMGDLEEAAANYGLVQSEPGGRALAFEARIRLAEVDLERGRSDEALSVLDDLRGRTEDEDDIDRVLLLKGRALESRGDLEQAIETYEGVAASHPRSEAAAESYYRVGLIHRDQYEAFEPAMEALKKARDASSRSDVGRRAGRAIGDIETLQKLLEEIAAAEGSPSDSLSSSGTGESAVEEPAEPEAFTEIVLDRERLDPGAPADSILFQTMAIDAPADSTLVSTVTADSIEQADPYAAVARARFLAAEVYLLKFEDPDRALGYYESIGEIYPESHVAPKAALAAAWVLEEWLGDIEGAVEAYRRIATDYADTEYGPAAEQALARLSEAGAGGGSR
jgi:TolA-binding protein